MTRKKILAAIAALAVAGIATLSLAGSANASLPPKANASVSPHGYVYYCAVINSKFSANVPILDYHGPYNGTQSCGAGHQIVVEWAGALPATGTGPKGDPGTPGVNGTNGTNGTDGKDGKDGVDAQALPYGIALVNVSRGGAAATTWATYSTTIGSPVGDTASGTFRMSCSAAKAPCVITVQAYSTTIGSPVGDTASGTFRMSCSAAKAPCVITVQAYSTTSGIKVYPRLDISRQDTNNAPTGNCEYADGVDNNNNSIAVGNGVANVTNVPLGIGGTLDCGSAQTYPTNGIASEIDVPAGFYDIAATFTFSK